jgi:hypothetical protein
MRYVTDQLAAHAGAVASGSRGVAVEPDSALNLGASGLSG